MPSRALNKARRAAAFPAMGPASASPGRPADAPRLMPIRPAHDRRRSCTGKVPFRNARAAVRSAKRATLREGHRIHAYPCEWCTAWHIGHPPALARRTRGPRTG
jgi:hypothetical protein